jgi:malonyl-CoA/methylmalonyl-CoA synthetase
MENKTAESFTGEGYFKTGDLGSLADDGRLTLVGRSNDMIISGGYNVYPKEIELVLDDQFGVVETAVAGLPHPDFGEAVTAFVVAGDEVTEDGLHLLTEEALANYKRPKRYVFLDALPRNAMGKVQKALLRDTYSDLYTDGF